MSRNSVEMYATAARSHVHFDRLNSGPPFGAAGRTARLQGLRAGKVDMPAKGVSRASGEWRSPVARVITGSRDGGAHRSMHPCSGKWAVRPAAPKGGPQTLVIRDARASRSDAYIANAMLRVHRK